VTDETCPPGTIYKKVGKTVETVEDLRPEAEASDPDARCYGKLEVEVEKASDNLLSKECIAKAGNCFKSCTEDDNPKTCDDLNDLIENGCIKNCPPCIFKAQREQMKCQDNTKEQEPEPEVCSWGEWQESSCSVTCGVGEQVFTRKAVSGEEINCNGCNTKVQNCTVATKCPVDCQWSAWSTSECTASCGGGTLTKERTSKLSEKELAETPSCRHKLVLVESCHTDECPVNCEWGRWQDQECDCSTGQMTRTRTKKKEKAHGGKECDGKPSAKMACHYLQCKVPYVIGKKGTICDEDRKIMGPSDCQKAAESAYLDLEWINKEPSDEVQKGCVMDSEREAWFNSRETGSEEGSETNVSPICKQDPNLCPEACKTECMNGPRKLPGRRNKHKNGYCYKWCSKTSNANLNTHNGKVGYCGVSRAIKSDSVDCRGCYKAFH